MSERQSTGQSRTDAIRSAIAEELARRRALIDGGDDLVSVSFTIRFQTDSPVVQSVEYEDRSWRAKRRERR